MYLSCRFRQQALDVLAVVQRDLPIRDIATSRVTRAALLDSGAGELTQFFTGTLELLSANRSSCA